MKMMGHTELCRGLLLTSLICSVSARPREMNEYNEDGINGVGNPIFISEEGSYNVKEGDSVTLPCNVQNLGPYPVIWKKGKKVLSAGKTITAVDSRYRIVQGHSLQIDRVTEKDAGGYTCSLSTEVVMELTHTLDVLYGPTVSTVPESGLVVAQRGSDEILECAGDGKPMPQLYWRKQTGHLPSGEATHPGGKLVIRQVSRDMAGVYECVAENSLGETAVGIVSLQVQYPPEIEVEKKTIHTGDGRQVKLTCLVYADPRAEVVWSREGELLDSSRYPATEEVTMGTRHTLTINSVREDDYGTYSCEATNSLGSTKDRMIVTGVADKARVTSPPMATAPDVYELSWEVQSYSPILEYKVVYRRSKFNATVDKPSAWKEVIVPNTGSVPVDNILYSQRIPLGGLQPATLYDLYIQASNKHGWNAVSDMFHFSTLSQGEAALESRIAGTGGSGVRRLHPILGSIVVFAFFILPALLSGA